jgi:oxygen-dependent protoporphyrinogen oxidase
VLLVPLSRCLSNRADFFFGFIIRYEMTKRYAVIGGGAAGLAAAWRLASAGVSVKLFERAPQVGGRARSEVLDGCVVDTGAQLFGSGFSALRRIAREVGADSLLVRSPGRDGLFRNGRIHPITYGSVSSMVKSGALPTSLKLKLGARYVPFLLRHSRQLDANDPLSTGADALDTTSVGEWGAHELGQDFIELLAYPLLGAYYGSLPEQTSVALYHSLAKAGLEVSVYAVRGGVGGLMQAIADAARERGAQIVVDAEVSSVESAGDVVRVTNAGQPSEFDAAIIALPAPHVAGLIELPANMREWLGRVRFSPSAVLALVLERDVDIDVFGISLLRTHNGASDLVAICVQSHKAPGLVPREGGLLVCLGAPHANEELVENGEDSVERMIDAVEQVFPEIRQRVVRAKLYRHAAGYPLFYPGYLKHLRRFPVDALPARVQLAGDYLVAPTVEGALRSGERAAQALLRVGR